MILSWRGWRPWHPGKVFSLLAMVSLLSVASGGVEHEACGGGAAETSGGALVGKLEGPEIVTDPVHFPTSYNEPPTLSELVKTGKLPPMKDRIGTDPLVVKPLHELGRYGGVWRRGFTGPADTSAGQRVNESDHLTYFDYTATEVVPNVAKAWDVSDGGRTFTFHLRRGMRWSDGHPFTADDFVFWFEDVYLNKDLIPTPLLTLRPTASKAG